MPESSTNGAIIQPNPYAGGQPAPPISMPGQVSQSNSGGSSSNNSQGSGQNTIIIDDEVTFSGPSTGLNGTPQQSGPSQGGNVQPTNQGTDFNNTVLGMEQGANGSGQNQSSGNATGWWKNGNDWYYIEPGTNSQAKGWKKIDGFWYYFNEKSGIMSIGWVKTKEKWYYLYPFAGADEGKMLTGWQYINNEWYYLETDGGTGEMNVGWKKDGDNTWYYFFPDGPMAHDGWVNINKKWYWFNSKGVMQAEIIIDYQGKKYYVDKDGVMLTSNDTEVIKNGGTIEYKGVTYEVAWDGVCTAIRNNLQEKIEAWMDCVERIGTWYAGNVTTYLAGPKNKNGDATRKYYTCSLIGMNVGDDCSSMVSACLVLAGIATTTGYNSLNFNKLKTDFTVDLGDKLEKFGFMWYSFDENYIPQRGDISVQHGYYYKDDKKKTAKHVEVVDSYDENTKKCYIWSWGQVNPTLPTSRTNWTTRTSGYWRIMK